MVEVYDDFTAKDCICLYQSNKVWTNDEWRYTSELKDQNVKYSLDYRIVLHKYGGHFDKEGHINKGHLSFIDDIKVIAENLGFGISSSSYLETLETGVKENIYFSVKRDRLLKVGTKTNCGKIKEVYMHTGTPLENGERTLTKEGVTYVYSSDNKHDRCQYKMDDDSYIDGTSVKTDADIFTTVKCFKNGNIHFQMNQKFVKKFNLEVSRLKGWIKSPKEAAQEFDISEEEASEYWESSFTLLPSHIGNLLPQLSQEEELVAVENEVDTVTEEEGETLFRNPNHKHINIISNENMLENLAISLKEYEVQEDVFTIRTDRHSQVDIEPLFEVIEDYKSGVNVDDGLIVCYSRDEFRNILSIELKSVYYKDSKSPIQEIKTIKRIGIKVIQPMLKGNSIEEIGSLLNEYFFTESSTVKTIVIEQGSVVRNQDDYNPVFAQGRLF